MVFRIGVKSGRIMLYNRCVFMQVETSRKGEKISDVVDNVTKRPKNATKRIYFVGLQNG